MEAHQSDYKDKDEQIPSLDDKKSLIKNWPFMSSLITYCVFSFHDMAYSEVPILDLNLFYCLIMHPPDTRVLSVQYIYN